MKAPTFSSGSIFPTAVLTVHTLFALFNSQYNIRRYMYVCSTYLLDFNFYQNIHI